MAAVQFFGPSQVYSAVENRKVPGWAIFQGGQFLFKCEETDMTASLAFLQQILDVLAESQTNAIYTIRFYEGEPTKGSKQPAPVKIKANTPYDGSFNFKIIDADTRAANQVGYIQTNSVLQQQVNELQEKLKKLEEQDEPDEPETIGSVMVDIVKDPMSLAQYVNIFRGVTGQPLLNFGNINGIERAGDKLPDEEKLDRLEKAIDVLDAEDPQLLPHLEKLAKMAKEDPNQFKLLLSMLGT